MNRHELMNWINRMEHKYPVDEWKVVGVHAWPRIRVLISHHLFEKDNAKSATARGAGKKHVFTWRKILNELYSLGSSVRYFVRVQRADYAFLGAFSHRVNHRGRWFNRFFDPVIEELEQKGYACARLEYGTRGVDWQGIPLNGQPGIAFVEQLVKPFQAYHKLPRAFGKRKKSTLDQYESFLDELPSSTEFAGLREKLVEQNLEYSTRGVVVYQAFFSFYLRLVRPNVLLTLCYYSLPAYAAIAAARQLRIPTIELQHGTQTGVHPAYSAFCRVPRTGFNILPNFFWVWDRQSEKGMEEWINRQQFHQVVQWGHPWVQYWQQQEVDDDQATRPLVLYSLQPLDELLEQYIVEAMQQSWQQYRWCLRLHPRQQGELANLHERIDVAGLQGKVTIDDGLSSPLPRVLSQTSAHLTHFSGTALEAAMFQVPTLLIDPLAETYFPDLVATGEAFVLKDYSAEALLKGIATIIKEQPRQKIAITREDYAARLESKTTRS